MSKRRRGFPSETNVKRGVRIVHVNKLLEESSGGMTRARAAAGSDSNAAASIQDAFDGANRDEYF